jgi:L,D-transpeptidase ErfK/SrfK|tara:strand:+ start:2260 stop:2847 length:588 start_codon:yes stop_codon:yes gene_type:complete
MRAFAPLLTLLLASSAVLPLQAGPLEDPDHPLRPLELTLAELPQGVLQRAGRQLVLHRGRRQLLLIDQGQLLARYPVAVGMVGWETPAGRFSVINKVSEPDWSHPQTGDIVPGGTEKNPLGSRWIGFYRDCVGRKGFDGERMLDIKGCTTAGFHGTPHRWTVGHAVSHGCVRLFDEHIKDLYGRVRRGTPVTVLP